MCPAGPDGAQLEKRDKNAPNSLDHRQVGKHSTNPTLHLPEEAFESESKTVGSFTYNQAVICKVRGEVTWWGTHPPASAGVKKDIFRLLLKNICCGFQPRSGISLQPRIKDFVSLSNTEVASHHDHQHSFWLAQANSCPAEFHHGPCFKVSVAPSALRFFLSQIHPLVRHGQGERWYECTLPSYAFTHTSQPVVTTVKCEIAYEILFFPCQSIS